MQPLRIALTKGRLEKTTIELLEKIGYNCDEVKNKGRRLILPVGDNDFEVVLAKAADVITYVEHGVCDLGVVGKDTILENGSSFYELLDLNFGKCRFALATKKDIDFYSGYNTKTIATKYPNVTRAFFDDKNMDVRIIKIEGSVELAPLVGLSDAIVDIVETGSTLRENGLGVLEVICPVSARVVVNPVSMKMENDRISRILGIKKEMEEKHIPVRMRKAVYPWSAFVKNSDGLLPVVVQEAATDQVLMVAYMNEEAYEKTIQTGKMTYWSRSRKEPR